MALTVALIRSANTAMGKQAIADVTFDSSYPTNGETIDFTAAPFTGLDAFTSVYTVEVAEGPYTSAGAKLAATVCTRVDYDFSASRVVSTGKLVAYAESATGEATEVANTTDLSTVVVRMRIMGT